MSEKRLHIGKCEAIDEHYVKDELQVLVSIDDSSETNLSETAQGYRDAGTWNDGYSGGYSDLVWNLILRFACLTRDRFGNLKFWWN